MICEFYFFIYFYFYRTHLHTNRGEPIRHTSLYYLFKTFAFNNVHWPHIQSEDIRNFEGNFFFFFFSEWWSQIKVFQ